MMTAAAAPAMACGGGLFQSSCSPCGYTACAPVYVAPVYSGCNAGCGGVGYGAFSDAASLALEPGYGTMPAYAGYGYGAVGYGYGMRPSIGYGYGPGYGLARGYGYGYGVGRGYGYGGRYIGGSFSGRYGVGRGYGFGGRYGYGGRGYGARYGMGYGGYRGGRLGRY